MEDSDDEKQYGIYDDEEEEEIEEESDNEKEKENVEIIEESDEDDENEEENLNEFENIVKKNNENIQHKYITKYEKCRLLEVACLMISDKNFILPPEIPKEIVDIIKIAEYWYENRKTIPFPLDIERPFFNSKNLIVNITNI
jgi:hypothetical protein